MGLAPATRSPLAFGSRSCYSLAFGSYLHKHELTQHECVSLLLLAPVTRSSSLSLLAAQGCNSMGLTPVTSGPLVPAI